MLYTFIFFKNNYICILLKKYTLTVKRHAVQKTNNFPIYSNSKTRDEYKINLYSFIKADSITKTCILKKKKINHMSPNDKIRFITFLYFFMFWRKFKKKYCNAR